MIRGVSGHLFHFYYLGGGGYGSLVSPAPKTVFEILRNIKHPLKAFSRQRPRRIGRVQISAVVAMFWVGFGSILGLLVGSQNSRL